MTLTPSSGFPYYIQKAGEGELLYLFSGTENHNFISSITEAKAGYRYAEGKWSIKQVLGHITDHERIMTYRALRFSRKDETLLPGYDQDMFVENARFDDLKFEDLLRDYYSVRQSTICLLKSMSEEQLQLKGTAWKFELTVEDFFMATIGHENHHVEVLKERYF